MPPEFERKGLQLLDCACVVLPDLASALSRLRTLGHGNLVLKHTTPGLGSEVAGYLCLQVFIFVDRAEEEDEDDDDDDDDDAEMPPPPPNYQSKGQRSRSSAKWAMMFVKTSRKGGFPRLCQVQSCVMLVCDEQLARSSVSAEAYGAWNQMTDAENYKAKRLKVARSACKGL